MDGFFMPKTKQEAENCHDDTVYHIGKIVAFVVHH
jgi:hypothetical protein